MCAYVSRYVACVRVCIYACVRVCVCACSHVCVCVTLGIYPILTTYYAVMRLRKCMCIHYSVFHNTKKAKKKPYLCRRATSLRQRRPEIKGNQCVVNDDSDHRSDNRVASSAINSPPPPVPATLIIHAAPITCMVNLIRHRAEMQ